MTAETSTVANSFQNYKLRSLDPVHYSFFQTSFTLLAAMGCGASKEDNAGKARNDEIENQLKRDKMAQRNEIKMLLLGMDHTTPHCKMY